MEIPKPVAWLIIIVVALLAIGTAWYLSGGQQRASNKVSGEAYPQVKGEMRLPDSELQQGPPPLPGVGGR
jgi:hypothetical protein